MFSRNRNGVAQIAGTVALLLAFGAQAKTLEIPVGSQGAELSFGEARGMKKNDISTRLGEPLSIMGPVGEPAITRWEYNDFYVFFERDTVLHTVKKPRG
ncbi:hypothetical protein [Microbulbifer variabilis]|jgi:hypothetical protein|uniref:Lipoprotein SmpA/OmlA domain-containing protein n=1 Tax=Microbulbifer variabilis TaxID=266805 RepID=A0ABY4VJT9_9GAMM|nr:hypothetical protein [Microbulbifer variabilis]USD23423.1 hypothetical protein MJO52_09865 [Microbulbifer variabilis]